MPLPTAQRHPVQPVPVSILPTVAQRAGGSLYRSRGSIAFAAGTDNLNLGTPTQLNNLGQATYTLWVYARSAGGGNGGRIFIRPGGGINIQTNNGTLTVIQNFSTTNGNFATTQAGTIPTFTWAHLAVIYDRTSVSNAPTFCINGQVFATTTSQTPVGSASNDSGGLVIGNNATSGGIRGWDGFMADLRVYNRLLATSEVADLYATGNPSLPGLALWLPMDGANVVTAYDLSSFSTNATISGAVPTLFARP